MRNHLRNFPALISKINGNLGDADVPLIGRMRGIENAIPKAVHTEQDGRANDRDDQSDHHRYKRAVRLRLVIRHDINLNII